MRNADRLTREWTSKAYDLISKGNYTEAEQAAAVSIVRGKQLTTKESMDMSFLIARNDDENYPAGLGRHLYRLIMSRYIDTKKWTKEMDRHNKKGIPSNELWKYEKYGLPKKYQEILDKSRG